MPLNAYERTGAGLWRWPTTAEHRTRCASGAAL